LICTGLSAALEPLFGARYVVAVHPATARQGRRPAEPTRRRRVVPDLCAV